MLASREGHGFPKSSGNADLRSNQVGTRTTGLGVTLVQIAALALVWVVVIVAVNPMGEFMINDDWSFVRILEALRDEGRLIETGWGKGGPAAIVHVLWGWLFTGVGGFSLTMLRVSVLTLGVFTTVVMLRFLRSAGSSPALALWATLTVLVNPLFLSQSFTFMTDITFTALLWLSIVVLDAGARKSRTSLVVLGLLVALCSILTRQIGIVIPIAFIAACWVHPCGKNLGRAQALVLSIACTLVPWLAYEYFLSWVGSTPVTQHQVFHNILAYPLSQGVGRYLWFLYDNLFHKALGYTCFLISPVLGLRYHRYLRFKPFLYGVIALTVVLVLVEGTVLTGMLHPRVEFHRNVIYDLGIGPVLLKDTYVLGMQRGASMPPWLYCFVVYWAAIAVIATVGTAVSFLGRLWRSWRSDEDPPPAFAACLCFFTALCYLVIITVTKFHDRYLIPVCILLIAWLAVDRPAHRGKPRAEVFRDQRSMEIAPLAGTDSGGGHGIPCPYVQRSKSFRDPGACRYLLWRNFQGKGLKLAMLLPAAVPFLLLALFTIPALRDFMEMKRALREAQTYVVDVLGENPCHVDGGFEFNGYHCYRKEFEPRNGLSWWWVDRENYLIALGPLPGYKTVHRFPFSRVLSTDGAVTVLQRKTQGERD